jgi:hypothetical protein
MSVISACGGAEVTQQEPARSTEPSPTRFRATMAATRVANRASATRTATRTATRRTPTTEPTKRRSTATPRPTQTPVADTLKPASLDVSPLQRQSAPPQGVEFQLALFDPSAGGNIICDAPGEAEDCVVEITDELTLAFGQNVTSIQITWPDGTVEAYSDPVYLAPGQPLGVYIYEAVLTNGRTVTGAFTVQAATERTVLVRSVDKFRHRSEGLPGMTFDVHLAGFQPSQRVILYLYKYNGVTHSEGTGLSEFEFFSELGTFNMSGRGEAVVTMPTEQDSLPGKYVVLSDPAMTDEMQIRLVSELNLIDDRPPTPAPTAERRASTAAVCGTAVVVDVAALSIRAEPDRDAAYLGEVPQGGQVDVLCVEPVEADGRVWVWVRSEQVEGWMSTNYLVLDE